MVAEALTGPVVELAGDDACHSLSVHADDEAFTGGSGTAGHPRSAFLARMMRTSVRISKGRTVAW